MSSWWTQRLGEHANLMDGKPETTQTTKMLQSHLSNVDCIFMHLCCQLRDNVQLL